MNKSISKHRSIFDGEIDIGVARGLFNDNDKRGVVVMENVDGRDEIETLISVDFGLDFFVGKCAEFGEENACIVNGLRREEEDGFGTAKDPIQFRRSFRDGLLIKGEEIGSRNHSSLLNDKAEHKLCLGESER